MKKKEKIEIPDIELLELFIEFCFGEPQEETERKFKDWVKDKINEEEDKK